MYSRIAGVGGYLPGTPISNDALIKRHGIDSSNEWIVERSGIRARYIAAPGTTSSDLALEATTTALAQANWQANDIDLIVFATSTPDFVFPSSAAILQGKLGMTNCCPAFDLQAVCSGFAYALTVADQFIRCDNAKRVLVVGAEVFSNIIDWQDRRTSVLFGDGAGAVLLEAATTPGIIASVLHTDGRYASVLQVPGRIVGGQVCGDPYVRMDGPGVFKLAVKALAEVAAEVLAKAELNIADIDWLIPHQANDRIIQATGKKLGVPAKKVVSTVAEHGNTSAASIPLALAKCVNKAVIKRGDKVLVEGVGGGFTWGALIIEY